MSFSHNIARDNLVINGQLYIPKTQQDGSKYFTYVVSTPERRTIRHTERNSTLMNDLKSIAKVIGIKGACKMRQAELLPLVWNNVIFED